MTRRTRRVPSHASSQQRRARRAGSFRRCRSTVLLTTSPRARPPRCEFAFVLAVLPPWHESVLRSQVLPQLTATARMTPAPRIATGDETRTLARPPESGVAHVVVAKKPAAPLGTLVHHPLRQPTSSCDSAGRASDGVSFASSSIAGVRRLRRERRSSPRSALILRDGLAPNERAGDHAVSSPGLAARRRRCPHPALRARIGRGALIQPLRAEIGQPVWPRYGPVCRVAASLPSHAQPVAFQRTFPPTLARARSRPPSDSRRSSTVSSRAGCARKPSSLIESRPEPRCPAGSGAKAPGAGNLVTLPWGLAPYDAYRKQQRPTPGLPHLAVLRLQAFSAS